jgi:phage-related protein
MYNHIIYNAGLYNGYAAAAASEALTLDTASVGNDDVLVVDTDAMTVKMNGAYHYAWRVKDNSIFFNLLPGVNTITFTGSGTVDIEIKHKARWY